jgi:hypothetical protein
MFFRLPEDYPNKYRANGPLLSLEARNHGSAQQEVPKMNPPVYLLIHLQRGHGLYEDQRLLFPVVTRPADFP